MALPAPKPVPQVLFETRGRIAIITLNQPKKLNALSQDLYYHVSQILRHIDSRDDLGITVLTAKGSGADVSVSGQDGGPAEDVYKHWLQVFMAYNMNVTHAFYTHRKILVSALNGPAVGLSAALIGHSDFIYAAPHAYLLCPFSSLGLVAEGLASRALYSRLGPARGNEALLMSKRISCEELLHCGFVNKVFETQPTEDAKFLELVLEEVRERLGEHLVSNSLVEIKAQIRGPERNLYNSQSVVENFAGMEVFLKNIPQVEFRKIANGEKRHKL